MKYTLSPIRAYFLGLWKANKTKEGVGIKARKELCEIFIKIALEENFIEPNKIKYEEFEKVSKCFFYQSALLSFLEQELERRDERFKFKNDFAGNYFAALFESTGKVNKDKEIFAISGDKLDEIILLRLGFRVKKQKDQIIIFSTEFYNWVSQYFKIKT
jgi:hypothetical protein